MKSFKDFLTERKITIRNDSELVKALYDVEANASGRAQSLAGEVAEYVEENGLDHKASKMITDMSSALGNRFTQSSLVDAIEDYVEQNL